MAALLPRSGPTTSPTGRSANLRRHLTRLSPYILVAFVFSLTVLVLHRFSTSSRAAYPTIDHVTPTSGPILGSQEDPLRMYFPAEEQSSTRLKVAAYNQAPTHYQRIPLFIGFTLNGEILLQAVLSYIAAGWPPENIVVIDNTGTFDANNQRLLSKDNPFFLNYKILRSRYGVSVLQTPVLLSFSQLQNFYIRTAMAHSMPAFFWSHMDVVALSDETEVPYKSLYSRAMETLGQAQQQALTKPWALKWFAYDRLTLVNVGAWRQLGAWDTFIPYYYSDCDAYSRMVLSGYNRGEAHVNIGHIFDVASVMSDPLKVFFGELSQQQQPNSSVYQFLVAAVHNMEIAKLDDPRGRNTWQMPEAKASGGAGQPWTYDPTNFQKAWWQLSDAGRAIYESKWGDGECNLDKTELRITDQWKHDPVPIPNPVEV